MGNVPVKTIFYPKTGMCRDLFSRECCENCPHQEECRAKEQKKNYAVHVLANMTERAKYLEKLPTDKYLQYFVEGIMLMSFRILDVCVPGGSLCSKLAGAYDFNELLKHNKRTRGSMPKL